jgi:hypothetical protein
VIVYIAAVVLKVRIKHRYNLLWEIKTIYGIYSLTPIDSFPAE